MARKLYKERKAVAARMPQYPPHDVEDAMSDVIESVWRRDKARPGRSSTRAPTSTAAHRLRFARGSLHMVRRASTPLAVGAPTANERNANGSRGGGRTPPRWARDNARRRERYRQSRSTLT